MAFMTRARSVSCSSPPISPGLATSFNDISTPPLSPSRSSASSVDGNSLRRRRRSSSSPGEPPVLQSTDLLIAGPTVPITDLPVADQQHGQPEMHVTSYTPRMETTPPQKAFQSTLSPTCHFYPPHYMPQHLHPHHSMQGPPPYSFVTLPDANKAFVHHLHAQSGLIPPSPPVTPTSFIPNFVLENGGMVGPPVPYPVDHSGYYAHSLIPYPHPMHAFQGHHRDTTPLSSGALAPTPYWQMPFMAGPPSLPPSLSPPREEHFDPYAHQREAPYMPYPQPPIESVANRLMNHETILSKGIVKFFIVQKGYGFIRDQHADDLGTDVFVHYTAIKLAKGFRCLAEGEGVEYTLVKAIQKQAEDLFPRGPKPRFQALNVTGPGGASVIGPSCPKNIAFLRDMASDAETRNKAILDGTASDNAGLSTAMSTSSSSSGDQPRLLRNGRPRKPPIVPQVVEVPTSVARRVTALPHQSQQPYRAQHQHQQRQQQRQQATARPSRA
ncbi:hypothetical protein JCM11251_005721 [Rhodosporidiobolus azoricus]